MADEATDAMADDVELALRMMEGDQDALRHVINHYGPKVKGALRRKYGRTVDSRILEEAFYRAAYALWTSAGEFDDSKGSLGGLFYTCACNEVVTILRKGDKAPLVSLDALDNNSQDSLTTKADAGDPSELSEEKRKLFADLQEVIAALPGNQRAITEADLAAGCDADNAYLAEMLGTTRNSVYVSRNKAREKIKLEMRKRGYFK